MKLAVGGSASRLVRLSLTWAAAMIVFPIHPASAATGGSPHQRDAQVRQQDGWQVHADGKLPQGLGEQILWQDERHTVALFLPENVTVQNRVEELPMKDYQKVILEQTVDWFRDTAEDPGCFREERPAGQGAAETARPLPKLVVEQDVSFVGRVRTLIGGYSPWYQRVVTAAYLEVEEVLHGQEVASAPKPPELVAILFRGGRTTIAGTPLCGEAAEGFDTPFEGQRFLVAGRPWAKHALYFRDEVRLPIEGNQVIPQPVAELDKHQLPVALSTLRNEVRDGTALRLGVRALAPHLPGTGSNDRRKPICSLPCDLGKRASWRDRGMTSTVEERILWMDQDHETALFLPERTTFATPTADLPMKDYQRRILDRAIAGFKNRVEGPACFREEAPAGQGASGDARPLPELIAKEDVSLVGEVKALVGGYTPWYHRVVTAAYVEVEEVLHGADLSDAPRVGDLIAVLYRGGKTTVAGTPLCGEGFEGFDRPFEGQRVVLAGRPWSADRSYFQNGVGFPVRGGEVMPQPLATLSEGQMPIELRDLKLKISALFISADLLQELPLEDLPMKPRERGLFKEVVERAAVQGPACEPSRWNPIQGSAEETALLPGFISFFESSFAGTVVAVEIGWSPSAGKVGELVTVLVEEVIHDKGSFAPQLEQRVALFLPGGRMEYRGVLLCQLPVPGLYRPKVGDRLLSAGRTGTDSGFFEAAAIFALKDGLVMPQPFTTLDAHAIPRPLRLVRDEIRKELSTCPP